MSGDTHHTTPLIQRKGSPTIVDTDTYWPSSAALVVYGEDGLPVENILCVDLRTGEYLQESCPHTRRASSIVVEYPQSL